MVGKASNFLVAFGCDRDYPRRLLLESPDICEILFVAKQRARVVPVAGRDDYHRQILVDHGVGAVLGFARGIAFGVYVGNFLELERSVHGDGIVNRTAHEEKIFDL